MPIDNSKETAKAFLAVIIINFRTPQITLDCLNSIAVEVAERSDFRVFVVENGSGDDSAEIIKNHIERANWQSWCSLELSATNRGFSGGNNFGIAAAERQGGAKYYLLLNSDTLVRPGCLANSARIIDADPSIGALSCRVINADESIQNVCRKFPTPLRCLVAQSSLPWRLPALFAWADCEDLTWDRNTLARDVEWIGGAFMMLRGDWIAQHNGLNDRFFFYGEDVELCHRIWKTGFRCRYDPSATVVHLGGGSSDPSRMAVGERSFHQWRGRYMIQEICYGGWARGFLQITDLATIGIRVLKEKLAFRKNALGTVPMTDAFWFLARNWSKWTNWRQSGT